jgi:hypothetical protein
MLARKATALCRKVKQPRGTKGEPIRTKTGSRIRAARKRERQP